MTICLKIPDKFVLQLRFPNWVILDFLTLETGLAYPPTRATQQAKPLIGSKFGGQTITILISRGLFARNER
jgi:hypothetical protein